MAVVEGVVVALDIGFQDPAPAHRHQTGSQIADRLMHRSPGPAAVGAVQEVLLIYRLQHHRDRPLKDLILKGWHSNWPLLRRVTPFRDVHPANRRRLVTAGLETV